MWNAIAVLSLLLAGVPCLVFLTNLSAYRRLSAQAPLSVKISVLIPARNEAGTIEAALNSFVDAPQPGLEIIVLDDHSSDATGSIVQGIAARDPRVRLLSGAPLPDDWLGKNFACQQLAEAARGDWLIFMDADVRVTRPAALLETVQFARGTDASLVSGVPHQETRTWLEKLIVPLIHFVLLGFLPLRRMRTTADPRFAAACGQILAVDRTDYLRMRGHGAIRKCIHDAVALTRHFRSCGLRTDLFDATDSFHCRMYSSASQVWAGFGKNAHEGFGSNRLILPATLVLFIGQVAPVGLAFNRGGSVRLLAALAFFCGLLPRCLAAWKFQQSFAAALLHPLSVTLLLAIQWHALWRRATGRSFRWKGR